MRPTPIKIDSVDRKKLRATKNEIRVCLELRRWDDVRSALWRLEALIVREYWKDREGWHMLTELTKIWRDAEFLNNGPGMTDPARQGLLMDILELAGDPAVLDQQFGRYEIEDRIEDRAIKLGKKKKGDRTRRKYW